MSSNTKKHHPIHPKHPMWDRWADGMDCFKFNYKKGESNEETALQGIAAVSYL